MKTFAILITPHENDPIYKDCVVARIFKAKNTKDARDILSSFRGDLFRSTLRGTSEFPTHGTVSLVAYI